MLSHLICPECILSALSITSCLKKEKKETNKINLDFNQSLLFFVPLIIQA